MMSDHVKEPNNKQDQEPEFQDDGFEIGENIEKLTEFRHTVP